MGFYKETRKKHTGQKVNNNQNNKKPKKLMKNEQLSTKLPMDQGRNKELSRIQWKWMHNIPKLLESLKVSKSIKTYLKNLNGGRMLFSDA